MAPMTRMRFPEAGIARSTFPTSTWTVLWTAAETAGVAEGGGGGGGGGDMGPVCGPGGRRGRGDHGAVCRHEAPLQVHPLRAGRLEIGEHHQVRPTSRRNGPSVVQPEMLRRVQGAHPDGGDGMQSLAYAQADQMVNGAFIH